MIDWLCHLRCDQDALNQLSIYFISREKYSELAIGEILLMFEMLKFQRSAENWEKENYSTETFKNNMHTLVKLFFFGEKIENLEFLWFFSCFFFRFIEGKVESAACKEGHKKKTTRENKLLWSGKDACFWETLSWVACKTPADEDKVNIPKEIVAARSWESDFLLGDAYEKICRHFLMAFMCYTFESVTRILSIDW